MDEQRGYEGVSDARSIVDWESPPAREERITLLLEQLEPSKELMIPSPDNGQQVDATTLIRRGRQRALWAIERLKEEPSNPPTAYTLNTLGCAHLWAGEYDEAEAAFNAALEPTTPQVDKVKSKAEHNLKILKDIRKIL